MTLVGKFIKAEWINEKYGYKDTWLRRITRETKTQYISDSQRYFRNFKDGVDDKVFIPRFSQRYNKIGNSIIPRKTRLSNPDGYSKLTIIDLNDSNDINLLKCKYSYDELFKTDIRTIQSENSYPRKEKEDRYNDLKEENIDVSKYDFSLNKSVELRNDPNHWNIPLIKWLEDTFNVPVYQIYMTLIERSDYSILTESVTYMHINHFGGDKKILNFDENYHNRTIKFWLFDDKLVFGYEDGKDSH